VAGGVKVTSHLYLPSRLTMGGYTGCPRRNVPDFGRVFLMLKYTDITPKNPISKVEWLRR